MKPASRGRSALLMLTMLAAGVTAADAADFAPGWNLAGNARGKVIDVAETFGAATLKDTINTVWKWDAANQKWAFYAPSLADGGVEYAAGKGYQALRSILPGEGYWVNAKTGFSVSDPVEAPVPLLPWQLMPGWNLAATGANLTAPQVHAAIAPFSATTLWAWDSASGSWYFHAPSLSASDLAAFIASKSYRDFGTKTLGHGTGFWVNRAGAGASPTASLPALDQAKQMVAASRTMGNSWINASKTGALDAQIATLQKLASGVAVPGSTELAYRLAALNAGVDLYRRVKAGQAGGYPSSFNAQTGTTTVYTQKSDVPWGNYLIPGFAYYSCATNGISAVQSLASVTCGIYDERAESYRYAWTDGTTSANYLWYKTLVSTTATRRYTRVTITSGTEPGAYVTSAELREAVTTTPAGGSPPTPQFATVAGPYAGTLAKPVDGNGMATSFAMKGELPATTSGSAKMTVNVTAARSAVAGGQCVTQAALTYCPHTYAVTGAMSGIDAQGGTVYGIGLDAGSYLTVLESALGQHLPGYGGLVDLSLVASVQAAGMKFAGSVGAQDFKTDADGGNRAPTVMWLSGSFSDISTGGAGPIFNGRFDLAIDNYASYHALWPKSATNYEKVRATFSGTLQLPSRPTIGTQVTFSTTGPSSGSLSGQFTYGNGLSMTLSGTAANDTFAYSLTNQDGIVLGMTGGAGSGTLSKSGAILGTVQGGTVYYTDGSFESLN